MPDAVRVVAGVVAAAGTAAVRKSAVIGLRTACRTIPSRGRSQTETWAPDMMWSAIRRKFNLARMTIPLET